MKKIIIGAVCLILALATGIFVYTKKSDEAQFRTAKVERGDIVSTVSATGNLAAVVTVEVGTQVSGTIQKLFVDFNSPVRKGQTIAQIDPALFNAQVEQSHGNYLNAQANLQKARSDQIDAKRTLDRNRQLLKDGIVSQSDYDAAETKFEETNAGVKGAEGSVKQTRGSYNQALTNLRYSTIKSPVDGIVVLRNVDVGQTVAASFQTPTLFTIAQDLTKMEIETSVDEADISRVKEGQPVTFTVDAYPESRFSGTVSQIRNSPVITQNVVTYVVIVSVDNRDLKLKPGMTANVSIETARKDNVLKVPSSALRFRPKEGKEAKKGVDEKSGGPRQHGGKREGTQTVYLLGSDNKPVPVKVMTGLNDDGQVEVLEGNLKENDRLIIEQVTSKKKSESSRPQSRGPRF